MGDRNTKVTRQQQVFIEGIRKLNCYDLIKEERPFTRIEKEDVDEIKMLLFNQIEGYARKISNETLGNYIRKRDVADEIMQSMAEMFFEKLPEYNPYRATPTTYFSCYFRQVISEYMFENIYHLSQHHVRNVLKVYKVICKLESEGINWTEQMLAEITQLSEKVLKEALIYIFNFSQIDVDECFYLDSGIPTPEEICVRNETNQLIRQAIEDDLTEIENRIFWMRINEEAKRELPYYRIAEKLGMSVWEVKKTLQSVRTKLQNNQKLICLMT